MLLQFEDKFFLWQEEYVWREVILILLLEDAAHDNYVFNNYVTTYIIGLCKSWI